MAGLGDVLDKLLKRKRAVVIEKVQAEDYEAVRDLAYREQDRVVKALIEAGINPFAPETVLALSYMVAQGQGMMHAKELREAKKVGVM